MEKDINELTDALYGRKFKPDQLKGIFHQWLDEAALPRGEVYIAISDFRSTNRDGTPAALELPAIVTHELNKLLPGEKLESAVEKIVSAYRYATLEPMNIEIPNFKQQSLAIEKVKNIIDLLLQDKDLLNWLSPKNSSILFEVLKLDNLPLESVVRLYNSLPRFPVIRKRTVAAIYKKMNTFHAEPNFYIINFLDEKIHAEKGGIIDMLTEFMERLKAFLFPILSQLKQDDVFYLSSDHGFIERTGYRYKDTPRYIHGGNIPFLFIFKFMLASFWLQ